MNDTLTIRAGWHYARPGLEPAAHDVALTRPAAGAQAGLLGGTRRIALSAARNAHDHGRALSPLAWGAPDQMLEAWIPATRLMPHVDQGLEARVALGRMARAGIASVQVCHDAASPDAIIGGAVAIAQAAREIGIRVAIALPVLDINLAGYADRAALRALHSAADWAQVTSWAAPMPPVAEQIALVEEAAVRAEGDGVTVEFHAVGPTWCSPALLESVADRSAATGRRVFMHLLETTRQRRWCDAHLDRAPLAMLDRAGMLSLRLSCAHGVHLREDEIEMLAARGVSVSVNTSSNLRLGSGVAPMAAFVRHGLEFGLGLDSFGWADAPDPFAELRLARMLHRGTGVDPSVQEAALWTALSRGHSGGLPVDDIVLMDLDTLAPDIGPQTDPLSLIAARATAAHVTDLVVGGRVVVRDRVLTGLDLPQAERELHHAAMRAVAGADAGLVLRHTAALAAHYRSEEDPT
jgi:cytosine/adenosine deaminase-related metal-dependent hydrolase